MLQANSVMPRLSVVSDLAIVLAPNGIAFDLAERLISGAHNARGTMAPETIRAIRRGFSAFRQWCGLHAAQALPAEPAAVAAYVDDLAAISNRKAAGIRQAAWSIGKVHRLAGLSDPTKAEVVRQALERMARQLGVKQQQAAPIGAYEVRRIMEQAGTRPIDVRNLALLLVMRDLLARRSEVVALDVADVSYDRDGSGIATIRRSKTDQAGEGAELYLSPVAVAQLRRWTAAARIVEGPLFCAVGKGGAIGERLQAPEVARIVKRLAREAGLPATRLSGHSCRVGMAQDLVAAGADVAGVMQAGRWKSPQMPARYSARLQAKRGAVARLYERSSA